mgnify:FL=1
MAKQRRIPTKIILPFDYVVTVQQVPPQSEALLAEGGYSDGIWDPLSRIISVNNKLPAKRKRYIVIHEMQHALVDLLHDLADRGIVSP